MNARAALNGGCFVVSIMVGVVACSGKEFTPVGESSCSTNNCIGGASGTVSGSSSTAGDNTGAGGSAAVGGAGPTAGMGGVPVAGASGAAGIAGGMSLAGAGAGGSPHDFQLTEVLDNFESDGWLDDAWLDEAGNYSVEGGRLWCKDCVGGAIWADAFKREQEVFVTLAGFDSRISAFDAPATEINLLMRAQEDPSCDQITISYLPSVLEGRVSYCVDGEWTDLEPFELLVAPGQVLGGRLHLDDTLDFFVDGELVHTCELSDFPYKVGRIGVSGVAGDNGLYWDDFGGGNWNEALP